MRYVACAAALAGDLQRTQRDTMAALAQRGQHRTPVLGLMLAAIAQTHSAVVLHYDSDYERIAAITGQVHEWIVPRGAGHGKTADA